MCYDYDDHCDVITLKYLRCVNLVRNESDGENDAATLVRSKKIESIECLRASFSGNDAEFQFSCILFSSFLSGLWQSLSGLRARSTAVHLFIYFKQHILVKKVISV